MRILMLGWEFPPFIAGGLGTACNGLTRALDRLGHEVLFVLPREADSNVTEKVRIVGPNTENKDPLPERQAGHPAPAGAAPKPGEAAGDESIRSAPPIMC